MNLKEALLKDTKSFEKIIGRFTGYNLGKNQFIKSILKQAGFDGLIVNFCTHHSEWEAAKHFRQTYFFDKVQAADPYTWTFDHQEHVHLVLYQGVEIIGYSHIQFWQDKKAVMHIIVIDKIKRKKGFGTKFLKFIEKWLKTRDYNSLHAVVSPESLSFYRKHSYINMPFNDLSQHETDPQDTSIGKIL